MPREDGSFEAQLWNLRSGQKIRRPDWGTDYIMMGKFYKGPHPVPLDPEVTYYFPCIWNEVEGGEEGQIRKWEPTDEDVLADDWQVAI